MKEINVQLYSFGPENPMTVPERIRAAAEIGFTGVEFAGGYDDIPVEEMQKVLAEAGIKVVSAHVGLDKIEQDIPYLAKLGAKYVICPGTAFNTAEEAKEVAADLNRLGKLAAEYGMKTGLHNHTNEFYQVDGKYLLDYLIENTDPAYVSFEIDCGWASAAGINPVEYIKAHAGRICAIHIKENNGVIGSEKPSSRHDKQEPFHFELDENGKPILPPEFLKMMEERDKLNCPQGQGIVDWQAVKDAADAQYDDVVYVVEREASYGGKDRIACLKEDIAWIQANLK